jgi:hypothetical protein
MNDRRIFHAASDAALNSSLPRETRLTAIRVLVGQFDPALDVVYRTPSHPDLAGEGSAYAMLGQWAHEAGVSGANPLSVSERREVIAVLRRLGQLGGDDVVRKVSGYLANRLAEAK